MSASAHILIVDDDISVCVSLALLLKQHGYSTASADSPAAALAHLRTHAVDLVLQDMNFSRRTSGEEGLELLAAISEQHAGVPVLLMTAWGSIDLAVAGVRAGARDFFTKPWDNEQLLARVRGVLDVSLPSGPLSRAQLDTQGDFSHLIGEHPAFLQILHTILRIAATPAPVLILGESGTGKEQVATAIHRNSARAGGAFVAVNMGAIPSSLFESEMFGHVRGAFTDARSDRQGYFSVATGGSLFLDEIGEMPRADQAKLLRVLQDQQFQPVGSARSQQADVRIISATNQELASKVARGEFREDLWYRLNLITLRLPPLRERRQDIPLLARHFLAGISREYAIAAPQLASDAEQFLLQQSWPGNIRELKQTLTRAALLSAVPVLRAAHFRQAESVTAVSAVPASGVTLDDAEKQMVLAALEQCAHNVSRAARQLGISRAALYRRMEKYALTPADEQE